MIKGSQGDLVNGKARGIGVNRGRDVSWRHGFGVNGYRRVWNQCLIARGVALLL